VFLFSFEQTHVSYSVAPLAVIVWRIQCVFNNFVADTPANVSDFRRQQYVETMQANAALLSYLN